MDGRDVIFEGLIQFRLLSKIVDEGLLLSHRIQVIFIQKMRGYDLELDLSLIILSVYLPIEIKIISDLPKRYLGIRL